MKKKVKLYKKINQPSQAPSSLSFLTYYDELAVLKCSINHNISLGNPTQTNKDSIPQFTPEQREQLKNAFRYICRLAFKQSQKYPHQLKDYLCRNIHKRSYYLSIDITLSLSRLLSDAETISGQRYFKEYIQNLQNEEQLLILEYMIWFLQQKYLRYIKKSDSQKGKRKSMKKQLYLKFKNQVMLPYMLTLREEFTSAYQ